MGAYRLGLRRRELFAVAFGIIIFLLIPLSVQTVLSATDPPVGTVWSITKTENAGTNGELNVMWSVKLDALSATQVTYRYTFTGEIGFITSQPCNNPNPVPLPFDRLAFKVFFSAGQHLECPLPWMMSPCFHLNRIIRHRHLLTVGISRTRPLRIPTQSPMCGIRDLNFQHWRRDRGQPISPKELVTQ